MNHGWQPHIPPGYAIMARTGQAPEAPPPPRDAPLLEDIKAGFNAITPTLLLTGVAIGFASAIGAAVGTILISHFRKPSRRR